VKQFTAIALNTGNITERNCQKGPRKKQTQISCIKNKQNYDVEHIEKNIISLIQSKGGKVALGSLVSLYKEEFQSSLPVPHGRKLSKWVKQFTAIDLSQNDSNCSILVKKGYKREQIQIPYIKNKQNKDVNVDVKEGHIVTLLQQNNNRIKLNEVSLKYKSMLNVEMPIPGGMKLWDWFGKFKSVDVEFNSQNNQTYLVLLRPSDDDLAKEEEKNILRILLEHNDGCVEINDMRKIFKSYHNRSIFLVAKDAKSGKTMNLVEWLCSLNSVVLISKPLQKQIFVAKKHDVQCKYDREVSESAQNKGIGTEVMSEINCSHDDTDIETSNSEATPTATGADTNFNKTFRNSSGILAKRKRHGEDRYDHHSGVLAKKVHFSTALSPNSKSNLTEVKIKQEI